jgi:hypothetical protein
MLVQTYRCPECKARLTRVTKWLGYCCESCRLAVTMISAEQVRVTPLTGKSPIILSVSELGASA